MLMRAGIGWGYMPEPMIRDDVYNGPLVAPDVADAPPGDYQLHSIYRADTPPGPAASWLI